MIVEVKLFRPRGFTRASDAPRAGGVDREHC